jgi:hypothetical protein
MNQTVQKHENYEADLAVERAIGAYIESRKEKVPHFVKKHFSFKGAVRLNRKAFGSDLYKVPLNVAWTIPYITLKASSSLMKKMGLEKFPSRVERLPVGFETKVQKEINWLIFTDLLEIPYAQGKRRSAKDALLEAILIQPEISSLFIGELYTIYSKSKDPRFRPALEKNLMEYSRSRTAASELAGNVISLSTGASVFGKMTPGALTVGGGLAAAIAQQTAISNFILGPTVGGLYYAVFPASASMGLVIASTGAVMAALATLTSFSGIIADPIQYKLGLHQKRLNRLIDCLDRELRGLGDSRLKIRDQYVSRVFDLADLFKKAARTFV